ncbi:MAG: hypothetical protein ACO3ZD_06650 [Cyanobium sp.]
MGATRWLQSVAGSLGRAGAERDLEVARRLGYWHTEEDRQLLRDHQAQLALARRTEVLERAARVGTVGMLAAAWAIPPLWPVAVVASFRVFPRTSRHLLLGVLGVTGATLVGSGVVVHQVLQSAMPDPPAALPAASPAAPAASTLAP